MSGPIKVVSFDCAQTLLWTDWQPHTFALKCAALGGLTLPPDAGEVYLRMFFARQAEFWASNRTAKTEDWRAFWHQMGGDWLARFGVDSAESVRIQAIAERELFSTDSSTFRLFEDVVPCIVRLRAAGYRLIVISNWDHSLHRCLQTFGLTDYFELVLASLEEGVEKPDKRLFEIALARLGVDPQEVVHVGDDPNDDVIGARNAGIRPVLIDRAGTNQFPDVVSSLDHLESALELGKT